MDCKIAENNHLFHFNHDWTIVDVSGKNTGVCFLNDGDAALIKDENKNALLKKIVRQFEVADGKTYRINVTYKAKNLRSELSVYALLSLYDHKGKLTRRLYFDRINDHSLEKRLKINKEEKAELELGLKGCGEVTWDVPYMEEIPCIEKRTVRVAAVQINPGDGKISYDENLKRIEKGFDQAADMGADIICFAETINDRGVGGYSCYAEKFEEPKGAFYRFMRKKSMERRVFSFFTYHEIDAEGIKRNTAILFDRNGETVGRYCKSHITIGEYEDGMLPGEEYPVFDTEFGKIGLLVCWDAYFPEPARAMALKGAELLLISTAGNPTHRHIARAMENGVYVAVACAATAPDSDIYPTKIISPRGDILAEAKGDGEVALAEIDLNCEEDSYIYWLSVGAADTDPHGIYQNEFRPEMYPKIL